MAINLANPVNWQSPLNRGLALWWMPLPGGPRGYQLRDLCGRYHGSMTNGAGWSTARYGAYQSVTTDGVDDLVSASVPQISAPLSIMMRVKITSAVNNGIFLSHDGSANNGIRVTRETSLLRLTLGGVANYTAVSVDPVNSQWSSFVIAWAGSGGAVNGYHYNHESGVYSTGSDTTGTMTGTPSRVTLSSDLFGSAFGAAMQVADVRIFNYAMSEQMASMIIHEAMVGYPHTINRTRPGFAASVAGGAVNSHAFNRNRFRQRTLVRM